MTKQEKIAVFKKMIDNLHYLGHYYRDIEIQGLCALKTFLYLQVEVLSDEEYKFISKYFFDTLPAFIYNWPECEAEPRRQWLQQQIDKLNQQ